MVGTAAAGTSRLLRLACLISVQTLLAHALPDVILQHRLAQQAVVSNWRYDPAVVCRPARMHGALNKTALSSAVAARLWLHHGSLAALTAAGVPIYSAFQVYISHRFRFIYIRQPKSSSTSIMAAIEALYCESQPCPAHVFTRALHPVPDDVWRRYFVFTAVRNPIARMVSTYNMFRKGVLRVRLPSRRQTPGPLCSVEFASFARDVGVLRRICETDNCCAFLFRQRHAFVPSFVDPHITQQSHALFAASGAPAVDYIARTEKIASDWEEVVAAIAQRSGRHVGTYAIANVNGRRAAEERGPSKEYPCIPPDAEAMHLLNETTTKQLAVKFAMDMQLLRFLSE